METEIAHEPLIPYLREIIIFLLASVAIVPLFQRLRVSPVIGFLLAGVLVGPHAIGLIGDIEGARTLGELGVLFLLFTIGLELSLGRLQAMRRYVFGLGGSQVMLTGLVVGSIAFLWGNGVAASVVLGASLALSSTALVMQLLIERGEIASRVGRVSFAILLFQDLAVAPLLALVTILAKGEEDTLVLDLALAAGKAIFAVVVIMVLGRAFLRPLFHIAALGRRPDVFMAMSVLLVLVTASATAYAGLSPALGAFLAGVLLAETEYRHQVETDIEPFRGLLLGLFFMSVGMGINVAAVINLAGYVAMSVIGLITIKAVIMIGLGRLFGLPLDVSVRYGVLLGESGEFAFVLIGVAMTGGIVPAPIGQFMLIVAAISMMLTPVLAILGPWLVRLLRLQHSATGLEPRPEEVQDLQGHVIIAGYGRVGQMVARILRQFKVPYVALDLNAQLAREHRLLHEPVFYGDVSRVHVLDHLRPEQAAAIVVTLDNAEATAGAVAHIRRKWPQLRIFVRARDVDHADTLQALGVTAVIPEALESSLALAAQVLQTLGASKDAVIQATEQIRREQDVQVTPKPIALTEQARTETS